MDDVRRLIPNTKQVSAHLARNINGRHWLGLHLPVANLTNCARVGCFEEWWRQRSKLVSRFVPLCASSMMDYYIIVPLPHRFPSGLTHRFRKRLTVVQLMWKTDRLEVLHQTSL